MKRLLVFTLVVIYSPLAFAASVTEVVSDSGIKAWLVEEHSVPLIAAKITFTDSGHAYDPSGKEGRASMTAALLMEGAGDLDDRAFAETLENHAIQLNMGVDEDDFDITLESLSEHKEKAFSLLGLALAKPRFDAGSIERVKAQTQTLLIQQEGQPGYQLRKAWARAAFGDHPYGKPQMGTPGSVAALERADFTVVTQRFLTRGNMVISVVGDIDAATLKRLLDSSFAALPERYAPDTAVPEIALPAQGKTIAVPFAIPQTMVLFGAPGLKRSDADYINAYVMNEILGGGGGLNSRLGKEIREKRGLAYSVATRLNPMRHSASWEGMFSTRSEQSANAIQTLRDTLKDFADNGVSDREFSDAKHYLMGAFVLGLDSNAEIANFLTTMQINALGIDYLERRNSLIDAVTKQSVEDMARRIAASDGLLLISLGKTPDTQ